MTLLNRVILEANVSFDAELPKHVNATGRTVRTCERNERPPLAGRICHARQVHKIHFLFCALSAFGRADRTVPDQKDGPNDAGAGPRQTFEKSATVDAVVVRVCFAKV